MNDRRKVLLLESMLPVTSTEIKLIQYLHLFVVCSLALTLVGFCRVEIYASLHAHSDCTY